MSSGIYKWINLETGKVLVGQCGASTGFAARRSHYLSDLRKNKYGNRHFQNAWNKYGESIFEFSVIEEIEDGYLTAREQYWVDFYRDSPSGVYNQVGPVDNPNRGARRSDEVRIRISEAKKGKASNRKGAILSEETKRKISEANRGRKLSVEAKNKISLAQFGKIVSFETRQKQSKALKGRKLTPEHRAKLSAAKRRK